MSENISQEQAEERAREVWPEAEGFLPSTRGWTFRVGAGYAYVTKAGVVAEYPQGTRFDAVSFMGRRTPPASVDGPGCTPATVPNEAGGMVRAGSLYADKCDECTTGITCEKAGRCTFEG